ncbi:beta-1, partial [Tropilaelaps mercedesae]
MFFVGQPNGQLSKATSNDEIVAVKKSLREEQQVYGDLVELTVDEHYTNLTLKVIQMIKYLSDNEQCKFIFKADDDTFARLDLMVAELASRKLDQWLYWGYFTGRASVYHKG